MRRLLTGTGVVVALALIGVSGGINVVFWSAQGRSAEERWLFGIASLGLDGLKVILPCAIVIARRSQHTLFVGIASVMFVVLTVGSLTAGIGFAAVSRASDAHSHQTRSQRIATLRDELAGYTERRTPLSTPRAVAVIDEELRLFELNPRHAASKGCSQITAPETRTLCADIAKLRIERAQAHEAGRLETQRRGSMDELQRLQDGDTPQPGEAQVDLFVAISGAAASRVRIVLIVLFAVLVELGSGLGLFLATAHSPPPVAPAPQPSAPNPPAPVLRRRQRMHAQPPQIKRKRPAL